MAHNIKQGGDIVQDSYRALEHLMKTSSRKQLESHVLKHYELLADRQEARLEQRHQRQKPFSQWIAQHPVNDQHNRYIDIIPFDKNRVVLGRLDMGPYGGAGDDYINASWIKFDQGETRKRYIATQGPLSSTCGAFWRMVLEHQVKVIVCLTPHVEKGKEKCAAYWPEGIDTTKQFEMIQQQQQQQQPGNHFLSFDNKLKNHVQGNDDTTAERWIIQVKNTQPEQMIKDAACILRQIQVICYYQPPGSTEKVERARSLVYQLHYLGWADHGVPEETTTLLELVKLANQLQPTSSDEPMVVHCSAGCGRTGTFCVVDTGIDWLDRSRRMKNNQQQPDDTPDPIYLLTDTYRKQRTTMVQTPTQYMYCYLAIWDGLNNMVV
ncbi:protein-tyrosine phosphatase-like protein [Chlamydoabsidia padenii]|nr:protein-tyrosine phosphatase-like protein [Chlamydoabsidia padenii]